MKDEVYSWRLSSELKAALEAEARRESTTVAGLLERVSREWLERRQADPDDRAEQERLRQAASRWLGALAGGEPKRSERARDLVRSRIRSRRRG